MKLRIVKKGVLYVPQQYKKSSYSYYSVWKGFGVRFLEETDARNFLELVQRSVTNINDGLTKVVYQNYQDMAKKEMPKKGGRRGGKGC